MSNPGERLKAAARAVHGWFFPPEVEVPECLGRMLAIVYPTLDARAATFHRGLPHVLKLIPNQAITLPSAVRPRHTRVYVHPDCWDPATVKGLGLIVHESFHVLQVQDAMRGFGLGLVRPFTVLYLACAAANRFRYDGHPMEADAYGLAGWRSSPFEATVRPEALPVEHLACALPLAAPAELAAFAGCCECLVTHSSGLAFWKKLAASTPGFSALARLAGRLGGGKGSLSRVGGRVIAAPLYLLGGLLVGFWLALWTGATAVLWLLDLLVKGMGALAAGLLWLAGSTVSVLSRPVPHRSPAP